MFHVTVYLWTTGELRQAAVERLFLAGHRKIGMIAGPEHVFTARERYLGYEEAFKKAGIEVQDSLVVHGDYTIAGGARAMKELAKQNPQMTAVFVSNYEMTVGAMIESNEMESGFRKICQ